MKATIATRLCCRSPSSDLTQLTLMFAALILQYLSKLVEGEVGDFTSPKPFHTRKVQGFNRNRIKLFTQVGGKLPMKVFALVADFPIQACNLSHTPPPAIRTFLLTAQCLVERPKGVQVRFQRLRVLYLLTRAQWHISVFHAEVCPNAFTCCGQPFRFYKVSQNTKPILTTSVTLYRDTADISFKLTVLMERISHFIRSPFTVIPFSEIECEAIVFQSPARLFKREGLQLMPFFDFRSAPQFLEKSDIPLINAPQLLLDRLTRKPGFPMRVGRPFQIGYVKAHCLVVRIPQPVLISLTLPLMEILVDLPHIIKQVAKPNTLGLIIKRMFVGFHGISHITPLSPAKWDGRHIVKRQCLACLPV